MEENNKKKRGWVKDAAIIFLAVLLVLTFFSNTILNRSLPEVATVYVQDGTITSKVRGTGTVTARENYEVTIEQTRKVQSVLVRVGDEVKAGDVLFVLQPGDSDELENAQKTLRSLEKAYQRSLITAAGSDYAKDNRDIAFAREDLKAAETARDEAVITPQDKAEYEAELLELEAEVTRLEGEIERQQTVVDACQASVDELDKGTLRELELQMRQLRDQKEAAEKIVREKQAVVDARQVAVDEAKEKVAEAEAKRDEYSKQDPNYEPVMNARESLRDAEKALSDAEEKESVAWALYGSDYNRLVREANFIDYDNKVYGIREDTEVTYRHRHSIPDGQPLTEEQKEEVEEMVQQEALEVLGKREDYISPDLDIYLTVAAERYIGTDMVNGYNLIKNAEAETSRCATAVETAEEAYSKALETYNDQVDEDSLYQSYNREVTKAQKALDEVKVPLEAAQKDLTKAQGDVSKVQLNIDDLQNTVSRVNSEQLRDRQSALTDAQKTLSDLQGLKDKAEAEVQSHKADMTAREQEYKDKVQAVRTLQDSLESMLTALEQKKRSDVLDAMDRQDQLDEIEAQRKLVAELSGEDSGTEVKASVAGKIQTLTVSAGHKAEAGNVLAVIEVPDLGYSMSFSVTTEQARRLRVGDTATVSNYYWGSQITATLVSMQTDPQNPQGSRICNFDVTGDVTAGNSLTISVGERNANYDMVVPNSAVRSDTNGSFVLMITAKNSPLGNRYFATRVNVEVVASDEQYSAISGAIEPYDSVITTASRNAPISSGDQVRLADSNN